MQLNEIWNYRTLCRDDKIRITVDNLMRVVYMVLSVCRHALRNYFEGGLRLVRSLVFSESCKYERRGDTEAVRLKNCDFITEIALKQYGSEQYFLFSSFWEDYDPDGPYYGCV